MWTLSFCMTVLVSAVALAEHDLPTNSSPTTRRLADSKEKSEAAHPERSCVRSGSYPEHLRFNEDGTALLLTADSGFETFSVGKDTPPKIERSSEMRRHNLGLGPSRDIYGLDDFSPDGKKLALITLEYGNESGRATGYFLGVYSSDGKKVFFERRIGKPPYPTILQFSSDGKSVRYGNEVFDAESGNRMTSQNQAFEQRSNQVPITRIDKTKPTKLDFLETESATEPKFSVEVRRKLKDKGSSFGYRAAVSPDRTQAAVAYYGQQGFELCLFNVQSR